MRHELEQVEVPEEHEARERTWSVVRAAFSDREPTPRRRNVVRPAAVLVAVAVVAGVIASPPGRAVVDRVREVVGVKGAEPALFSLPSPGRLLVASDFGVWVVSADGEKRLLPGWREASWSPFGRFVVAARANELAALEPDGSPRWTLSRAGARSPRWTGTKTDTRIAYVDRTGIRVVAGDGAGDRLLVRGGRGPISWRPGAEFVLALSRTHALEVENVDTGRVLWRATLPGTPSDLAWSADGSRLLVQSSRFIRVYAPRGRLVYELGPDAAMVQAAAVAPGRSSIAFTQTATGRSQLWVVPRLRPDASAARRLFSGTGSFDDLAWSPDGRWLLVTWPTADQWVFVRADGRGIRAASNISLQFHSFHASNVRLEGWCCTGRNGSR